MLKTTDLIIELLIAGVLVLASFAMLTYSLFPIDVQSFAQQLTQVQPPLQVLAATILTVVAYAVGLVSEFVARVLFEDWQNRIERKDLTDYFKVHYSELSKSPLLSKYVGTDLSEVTFDDAPAIIGEMRFDVLMKSENLYREIQSQLNQMRIIRVLFIFVVVAGLGIGVSLIRQLFASFSNAVALWLAVTIVLGVADIYAIRARFHRYSRAVLRSYRALLASEEPKK